jgi:hypothetical protein
MKKALHNIEFVAEKIADDNCESEVFDAYGGDNPTLDACQVDLMITGDISELSAKKRAKAIKLYDAAQDKLRKIESHIKVRKNLVNVFCDFDTSGGKYWLKDGEYPYFHVSVNFQEGGRDLLFTDKQLQKLDDLVGKIKSRLLNVLGELETKLNKLNEDVFSVEVIE